MSLAHPQYMPYRAFNFPAAPKVVTPQSRAVEEHEETAYKAIMMINEWRQTRIGDQSRNVDYVNGDEQI